MIKEKLNPDNCFPNRNDVSNNFKTAVDFP